MGLEERYSFHGSQPGRVLGWVLQTQLVDPLHLHTQARLHLHRECAFD